MRAARRIDVVAAGRPGEGDDDPLARLPRPVDAVALAVLARAPRRPGRRPTAARARAARRGCPAGSSWRAPRRPSRPGRCCRAPCAAAAPRASCRRARSGRRGARPSSGIVSLLLDAGDLLDDVVHRLEVLDVDRRDHVDAGVEQLLDVLPALLVLRARHVGVRELVDERDLGLARQDRRRRPSPRRSRRGTRSPCAGTTSRSPICSAVFARPWVSTKPTTTSVPRSRAPVALVEHGEGLADARRGAEVDAELPASHGVQATTSASSSARLSSSTLTPCSPRKPSERPLRVLVDEREHLVER